jgi:trehalose 6-phosphate phosphatase
MDVLASPIPPLEDLDHCALFLDLDGTLLPYAAHPAAARPPPFLSDALLRLHERLNGALALISGRTLASLDELLPGALPGAGQHGLEWRLRRGGPIERAGVQPLPGTVRQAISVQAGRLGAHLVEDKGLCLAVHYRNSAAEQRLWEYLQGEAGRQPGWELLHGRQVLELRPAGINKGTGCGQFLRQTAFRGRTPVYFGDDITDLDGFAEIKRAHGWTVAVGSRIAAHADRVLASPAGAAALLARLAA